MSSKLNDKTIKTALEKIKYVGMRKQLLSLVVLMLLQDGASGDHQDVSS